ncbi:uncharacterized protein LOC119189506 [Manduca sexta]|uniref:uncharacterized protein LOC119189506 n=1 Tax=Manduca sexta TaxID=7130 RepID=UPI0018901553|nr:uncharacterized protein LOC119189506 [Manduca sexta]
MSNHEQVLNKVLNKIAAEQKINDAQINIKSVSSGGANFTSQLFQATIGNGYKELKLFAKVGAIGEKLRAQVETQLLIFDVENFFYTKLYNIYESLQEKYNVPQDKRFVAPKCYGCSDKMYEEVIVLEDLLAQGFTVYDRMKSVYWNYAARVVEQIARFHALSVAFEKNTRKNLTKL